MNQQITNSCSLQSLNVQRLESMARDISVDHVKKIWILDLVVHEGSLKKAALRAKVSPSAISQALTSLEAAAGRRLLVRERGVVTPTPDGLSLLESVRPAFDVFAKLSHQSIAVAPTISWMNFGTYESIAIDLLPGLVNSLREKLPNTRLGLRIARTEQLLTMVRKGELCSALITEVDELERFYVREVGQDRLGLYVGRGVVDTENAVRLISKIGFGSLSPGKSGLPRYFQRFLRERELPRPSLLSESFESLRAAAAAGAIVAVLPARVARRAEDLRELVFKSSTNNKSDGSHRILVVSQQSCDRAETDFVAEEAARFL